MSIRRPLLHCDDAVPTLGAVVITGLAPHVVSGSTVAPVATVEREHHQAVICYTLSDDGLVTGFQVFWTRGEQTHSADTLLATTLFDGALTIGNAFDSSQLLELAAQHYVGSNRMAAAEMAVAQFVDNKLVSIEQSGTWLDFVDGIFAELSASDKQDLLRRLPSNYVQKLDAFRKYKGDDLDALRWLLVQLVTVLLPQESQQAAA